MTDKLKRARDEIATKKASYSSALLPSAAAAFDAALAILDRIAAEPVAAPAAEVAPPCWWIDHGNHGQITQREEEAIAARSEGKRVVAYAAPPPSAAPTDTALVEFATFMATWLDSFITSDRNDTIWTTDMWRDAKRRCRAALASRDAAPKAEGDV